MPRPISQARRQQQLLNSGFLDLTGSSRLDYGPVSLDALSDKLAAIAIQFAEIARQKLDAADRVASGGLSDSIIPTDVEIMGTVYRVNVNVKEFYKFVDKGVRGWQDEKGGNSPYQFKQYTGRSGKKNSLMVTAIRKWLIREGLKGAGKENAHKKASLRDRKRASITDSSTRAAIVMSKSIRKKGLRPSHFWTDALAEVEKLMKQQLGEAMKIDIVNNLTATNGH
jgi:hypothetical protein